MKKVYSLLAGVLICGVVFSGTPTSIKVINANENSTTIEFKPGSYEYKTVSNAKAGSVIYSVDKSTKLLIDGAPDLVHLTSSVIIPDKAKMKVSVIDADYYDLLNVEIAPSKGNLKRNVNPSDVPYTYGAQYSKNEFFPSELAYLGSPYILRDFRGQAVHVLPFQYNAVTKTLRVYTKIKISISVDDPENGENAFDRIHPQPTTDEEFMAIYNRQFINFQQFAPSAEYTPVSETGSMLIICDDQFASDMQPFVTWKNQKGIKCELIKKSVAGSTAAAIKTYIQNYYAANASLKYVLLVGDHAQVPASKTANGDSDNHYGYLAGNDSYPELFVGRFSATSSAHVQTMVNRTLKYEKTPAGTYYSKATTISSDQGPGDDNEYDYQHQRKIKSTLLAYKFLGQSTYTSISENYDGSQGAPDASGNPTATMIINEVNAGTGLISYTGHGSDFSFVSSGFSNTSINNLTNTDAHPFIWSVACVNGNFVPNATCFAEAWLRAGTPTAPKGALATLMSTINQSWDPPMEGQDAMVEILCEKFTSNIKRTFGGISMNGCMQMNDTYGSAGAEMTDTWNCFGDPSVMLYTRAPLPMTVSHITTTNVGVTTATINCNINGALICLSVNGVILGTGISNGTSAAITFPAVNTAGTIIDVVATSYNHQPYFGTITVMGSTGINNANIVESFTAFPVPATNTLNIALNLQNSGTIKLSIVNTVGQEVMQVLNNAKNSGAFTVTADVSTLSKGVYFVKMETENQTKYQRIVIQ